MLKKIVKQIVYYLWVLYSHIGWQLSLKTPHKLTVLITYYNPARIRHVNPQIRNLLKCKYIERVIISSHNPDLKIEDHVIVRNPRLVLLNQDVRRACGYRWVVAREYSPRYLVVIDDDILLFPFQLKRLFQRLIVEPNVPHGISGMVQMENGDLEFHQWKNMDVHYLTEVYAVTHEHLEQYFEMVDLFAERDENIPERVEHLGDFIVISQTGAQNPKIHKVGRIFRDVTFNTPGVANHKEEQFSNVVTEVSQAVKELRPQFFV